MDDPPSSLDKQWAKKYILDPLTAPEPNQECGPGSSFISPLGRSLSVRSYTHNNNNHRAPTNSYPTPPTSSSPTRPSFHPTNPFSPTFHYTSLLENDSEPERIRPRVSRNKSSNTALGYSPRSPACFSPKGGQGSGSGGLGRSQSVRQPAQPSRNQATGHARSQSQSATLDEGKGLLRRSGSLSQRFPGDMSHRPLDMIKREVRAADRVPHLRRKGMTPTDTIDGLDRTAIGGTYHHGGPYDATLMSRNTNKMYSPVEAVRESNTEALKATPRAYIQDSLEKHVPLQGTAVIPPGGVDMSGNVMRYEEGADLMREPDAAGGPYKRWDCVSYLPEDFKGKGEPSFTIERDLKENKARMRAVAGSTSNGAVEYEMQPQRSHTNGTRKDHGARVRRRSVSSTASEGFRPGPTSPLSPISPTDHDNNSPNGFSTAGELRRNNTTGRRITEGLKRRFGSLRRKKNPEDI